VRTSTAAHASAVRVQGYLIIFAALLVLTALTVGASYLQLSAVATVLVALAIATAKATLVVMFFMHLKGEKPMVYWPLGLTGVLFVALFAFLLWSEGDHLMGTQFDDAFSEGASSSTEPRGGGH
jgi:cytochrome c oxidase subunit 4